MKQSFSIEKDGFYGYFHEGDGKGIAVILYIDDDPSSFIGKGAVKWFVKERINVLAMSPAPKNTGLKNIPLDHIENAAHYLKNQGYAKVAIMGLSSTAMISLAAASLIPDITLTIAATPCDFVMEGTVQGKKDGAKEWPAECSSLSFHGKPLPYLPYAYRHPDYWNKVIADGRSRGDMMAAIGLFDDSEKNHPISDDEFIKVENIKGHLLLVGARDDVMWNTSRYIDRMVNRLRSHEHTCTYETLVSDHGTHFIFPEGIVKKILPIGVDFILPKMYSEAKGYTAECRSARLKVEKRVLELLRENG